VGKVIHSADKMGISADRASKMADKASILADTPNSGRIRKSQNMLVQGNLLVFKFEFTYYGSYLAELRYLNYEIVESNRFGR
jgi:hypothetical protein